MESKENIQVVLAGSQAEKQRAPRFRKLMGQKNIKR